MKPSPEEVTGLLNRANQGDAEAEAAFAALMYDKLRELAGASMRNERPGHLMQPTALADDALMRLLRQHARWDTQMGSRHRCSHPVLRGDRR